MNKQENKHIISIDTFDQTISLYQLIPSGSGLGIRHLKAVIDSIFNCPVKSNKPLSVLIVGQQGCRTHARSFLRALGLEFVNEMPAHLLQSPIAAIYNFFSPLLPTDAYIISAVDRLYPSILKPLYEVIAHGEYTRNNSIKNTKEIVAVNKPVLMTVYDDRKLPEYFLEKITHIVHLEKYNSEQLRLVILQRLKYCQIEPENEILLQYIVLSGDRDLRCIMRLLKNAITVMLADNRRTLTIKDVKRAVRF